MTKAYISYFTVYGYTGGLTSGSMTVKDDDTQTQTQFELTEAERNKVAHVLWDIVEDRKDGAAAAVRMMSRPLLVDHSDGRTIDADDITPPSADDPMPI